MRGEAWPGHYGAPVPAGHGAVPVIHRQTTESTMSRTHDEKGPRHVRVTIEYEYDGVEYEMKFEVDSHSKKYVDAIFFGHSSADQVRNAWRPDSTKTDMSGDWKNWPKDTIPAPVRRGPAPAPQAASAAGRPMVEHTPICWHDSTCEFWCV